MTKFRRQTLARGSARSSAFWGLAWCVSYFQSEGEFFPWSRGTGGTDEGLNGNLIKWKKSSKMT